MKQSIDNENPETPKHSFGRDGISGMVDRDRAIRAHEISQPSKEDIAESANVVENLLSRIRGQ